MRVVRVAGVVACLSAVGWVPAATCAWARPKQPPKSSSGAEAPAADRTLEKQSAWEQKVMGDDGGKRADLKKIAAAQRLGDEARKNPPPEAPKKHKDPNKEGARAKNEATIGLPIASDEKARAKPAVPAPRPAGKKASRGDSAHDELGALVATSLADDRKSGAAPPPATTSPAARTRKDAGRPGKPRGKQGGTAAAPSSLDRMFSAGAGK